MVLRVMPLQDEAGDNMGCISILNIVAPGYELTELDTAPLVDSLGAPRAFEPATNS